MQALLPKQKSPEVRLESNTIGTADVNTTVTLPQCFIDKLSV